MTCDATAPGVSLIEDRRNEHGRQRRDRPTVVRARTRTPRARRLSPRPPSCVTSPRSLASNPSSSPRHFCVCTCSRKRQMRIRRFSDIRAFESSSRSRPQRSSTLLFSPPLSLFLFLFYAPSLSLRVSLRFYIRPARPFLISLHPYRPLPPSPVRKAPTKTPAPSCSTGFASKPGLLYACRSSSSAEFNG